MSDISIEDRIKELEESGNLDPNCMSCEVFYDAIRKGKTLTSVFAPRHKPSPRCKSGGHPHCTCDTCF